MELTAQVIAFVNTIMTGVFLGLLFDFYRVLRRNRKPKPFVTWLTDLCYWLVATAAIFMTLIFSNWGELRLYVFIGLLTGVVMYYNLGSRYAIYCLTVVVKIMVWLWFMFKKVCNKIVIKPLLFFIRLLWRPLVSVRCRVVKCLQRTPSAAAGEKNRVDDRRFFL